MTLYHDILPDEPDEHDDERRDLEHDRDVLSDLLAVAGSASDAIGTLDSEAGGLVLDHVELSEDEATSELTSQATALTELVREVESAIEHLLAQANARLQALDEDEAVYANEKE